MENYVGTVQIILHNEFEHKTIKDTAQTESQYKQCNTIQLAVTLAVLQKHTAMAYRYLQ